MARSLDNAVHYSAGQARLARAERLRRDAAAGRYVLTLGRGQDVDQVEVVDWADAGDLFEDDRFEDGPRVCRPDHAPVIVLTTARGDQYTLPVTFGNPAEYGNWALGPDSLHVKPGSCPAWELALSEAYRLAARIRDHGSVDLAKWNHWRIVYGSDAYVDGDCERGWLAHEMATEFD